MAEGVVVDPGQANGFPSIMGQPVYQVPSTMQPNYFDANGRPIAAPAQGHSFAAKQMATPG